MNENISCILPKTTTFFDVETANRQRSSICSIGISVWEGGKEIDSFYSLVRPTPYQVDRLNRDVNGLDYCHLCNAPDFLELYPKIKKYFNGILVAHNAKFDMDCLSYILFKKNIPTPEFLFIDSLPLAKTKYESPTLDHLAEIYKIPTQNRHNSLSDARILGAIFNKMREDFSIEMLITSMRSFKNFHLNNAFYAEEDEVPDAFPVKEDLPYQNPETVEFIDKKFVITGQFQYISRKEIIDFLESQGATVQNGTTKQTNYILVGSIASDAWKNGNYGSKIEKALTLPNLVFLSEKYFFDKFLPHH